MVFGKGFDIGVVKLWILDSLFDWMVYISVFRWKAHSSVELKYKMENIFTDLGCPE